jgi:anti-sigma B factor antagonist
LQLKFVITSSNLVACFFVERLRTDQSELTRIEVDQETIAPGVAVQVDGELDLATVGDLEERIEHFLSQGSVPLLIDFTDCGFIDSSVLHLLVKTRRRLGDSLPMRFAVVARNQPLHVLRLTQLDREMPVFASLGEALSALQEAGAES